MRDSISATEQQNRVIGGAFLLGILVGGIAIGLIALTIAICRAEPLPTEEPGAPAVVIWKVS